MGLKATMAALAALSVMATAGRAAAQDSPPVPDDLARASFQWGVCRGHVIDQRYKGPETASAIADDAFRECQADEAKVRALVEKYYGASGRDTVDQLVTAGRPRLMREVEDRRSGRAFSDPSVALGRCVDVNIRAGAGGAADPDDLVDKAFAACGDLQKKSAASAGDIAQMRRIYRDRAITAIADARRQ
jgi:hypothetical protein